MVENFSDEVGSMQAIDYESGAHISVNQMEQGKFNTAIKLTYHINDILYIYIESQEERKEMINRQPSGSGVSMSTSSYAEEEYDNFDGDAVHLGEVDLVALMDAESQVQGQSRRVTSQRLIS